MPNIFISYSREHEDTVEALAADIEALDHSVWLDQKISGGEQWSPGNLLRNISEGSHLTSTSQFST